MVNTKEYIIQDDQSYTEFKEYLKEESPEFKIKGNFITTPDFNIEVTDQFKHLLDEIRLKDESPLIYGKDSTKYITSVDIKDDQVYLFKHGEEPEIRELKLWITTTKKPSSKWEQLSGKQEYKYVRYFDKVEEYQKAKQVLRRKKIDYFTINHLAENQMIYYGLSSFKGLKVSQVSRLGFDIEADGLVECSSSEVYTIANTFRSETGEIKRVFREDEYENQGEMIKDWCKWVVETDPDVMVAHNGFGYDLRYLKHVASLHGQKLLLGKDGSEAVYPSFKKNLRVDGGQTWEYTNCQIFGRSIVDTMHIAVKYDIGRNFPSWGLKPIIEHLGMVEEGRQFYDASRIRENWQDLEEREKIVKYCEDDGDDCLNLYELMVPSFFYMCQSIPKPFQVMLQGASGSWLNALFVRDAMQNGKSIPKATEANHFEGAISHGVPGIYSNCFKQDVASLYPSIMLEYKIHDSKKDPDGVFTQVVEFFTKQRLENKRIANETGDSYYRDLEQSQKVAINSLYGFLGANGLNYNSPKNAALITEKGREILDKAILWSTGENIDYWREIEKNNKGEYDYTNSGKYCLAGCDTDSILIYKKDQSFWTKEERIQFLKDMNEEYPDQIFWEDDGFYERVVVVKAKNYVLKEEGKDKLKFKGSAFKSSSKEIALADMMGNIVEDLVYEKDWYESYEKYLKEVSNITDIKRWVTKKSVTENLLEANDTTKLNVLDALIGTEYRVGDKVFLFKVQEGEKQDIQKGELQFKKYTKKEYTKMGLTKFEMTEKCDHMERSICNICNPHLHYPKMVDNVVYKLEKDFTGDYYIPHYLKRIYDTLKILSPVIEISRSPRYDLVSKFNEYTKKYLK